MRLTLLLEGNKGEVEEDWRHQEGEGRKELPAWANKGGWQLLGAEEVQA